MTQPIKSYDFPAVDGKVEKLFGSIPKGMSKFQLETLVVSKLTPERTYRQAVMELHKRYTALKMAEFRRKRMIIELGDLNAKIEKSEGSKSENDLLKIDREEKLHNIAMEDLLVEDALADTNNLLTILEGMKEYTREEIEKQDRDFWEREMIMTARRECIGTGGQISAGTLETLEKMGHNPVQVALEIRASVQAAERSVIAAAKAAEQLEKGETVGPKEINGG